MRGMFHHLLTMRTPVGRKFRSKMHGQGMPLIRTRPWQLDHAGVRRISKITGIRNGKAVTEDSKEISFASVIWCTGFHPGFDWIDLPILDEHGLPRRRFGRSTDVDGLYSSASTSSMRFPRQWSRARDATPAVSRAGLQERRRADWRSAYILCGG